MKQMLIALGVLCTPLTAMAQEETITINEADLPTPGFVMFHLDTCPFCQKQLAFLPTIQEIWPDVEYQDIEVSGKENGALFAEFMKRFGLTDASVPTTIINDTAVIQGFKQQDLLQAMVNEYGRPLKAPTGITLPEANPEYVYQNSATTNVSGFQWRKIANILLGILVLAALGYGLYSTTKEE